MKEVRKALFTKLNTDSTLTAMLASPATGFTRAIYHEVAPQDAAFPYVLYARQPGTPTYVFGGVAFETQFWMVKAVDRNTTADRADDIAARIDTLLNNGTMAISGRTLMDIRRVTDLAYPEVEDGQQYRHAGGIYRIRFS